ncbi:2OG-Fe(II) oxygenase [Streptomyces sp. NPDC057939]|uniref:2OG-Fe(II) oxygenase n=1 Tax=Streptomyces sp. NPDC057939 TaxID=3346284 RepID=UPI0036E7494B
MQESPTTPTGLLDPSPIGPDAMWRLPTPVCQVRNLLGPRVSARLLERAIATAGGPLVPATVGHAQEVRREVRRSHEDFGFALPELVAAVHELLPGVEGALGVSCRDTEPRHSLNVHSDGEFLVPHQDSWDTFHPLRAVTFVYYLHRTPRPFEGGALRVYDGATPVRPDGRSTAWEDRSWTDYPPEHDSILFFRPSARHEVRPVTCPSRRREDSRFAINGRLTRLPAG